MSGTNITAIPLPPPPAHWSFASFVPNVTDAYHIIAVAAIAYALYSFLTPFLIAAYNALIRPRLSLREKFGEWAVITGATDGVGKAYAFELAAMGLNIVCISRTAAKLTETAAEITSKYPRVQVKTVAVDFAHIDDPTTIQTIQTAINGLSIGILLNNVGVSYTHPEYFHSLTLETVKSLIALNVSATTIMTHLVLPAMVTAKRGAIVNISSFSATVPGPLLAEYSAAKAYIVTFTQALSYEYAHLKNIHFSVQTPAYITSKLSKIRHASLTTPSPKTYARSGVNAIGYEWHTQPYWAHHLMSIVTSWLPEWVLAQIVGQQHKAIRTRALKKGSATASGDETSKTK